MQLDLFCETHEPSVIKCPDILFDIVIDTNIWRGVFIRDFEHIEKPRLWMYRGLEGATDNYKPVSGSHIIRMPFGLNLVDVVENTRRGETFINAGLSGSGTVDIEKVS